MFLFLSLAWIPGGGWCALWEPEDPALLPHLRKLPPEIHLEEVLGENHQAPVSALVHMLSCSVRRASSAEAGEAPRTKHCCAMTCG